MKNDRRSRKYDHHTLDIPPMMMQITNGRNEIRTAIIAERR